MTESETESETNRPTNPWDNIFSSSAVQNLMSLSLWETSIDTGERSSIFISKHSEIIKMVATILPFFCILKFSRGDRDYLG